MARMWELLEPVQKGARDSSRWSPDGQLRSRLKCSHPSAVLVKNLTGDAEAPRAAMATKSALGCSHMTVRRYLSEGGWVDYCGRGRFPPDLADCCAHR